MGQMEEMYAHIPPRPIASVGYPEASESQIRRIAQQRLLDRFHNQYLNQLVCGVEESSPSNRTPWGCTCTRTSNMVPQDARSTVHGGTTSRLQVLLVQGQAQC